MSHVLQFPLQNFDAYCNDLHKLNLNPGYLLYTNRHAGNDQPVARLIPPDQLEVALAHIDAPSDETFKQLVRVGALLDTEWDRKTENWVIVSFEGWEVLHKAFSRLNQRVEKSMMELIG
ncbi:hypothetical protein [Methylomonas methanica]|jgi:hypothetical protein|uniref:Uncharacterized protein n=1 Tax=Methylomonas methanica TaxID=421 RepID=A0A177MTX8_METMH|nr:hypothetical protein [Methylomonas methanica]OAI05418.1 hypothetical protein A1353_11575 [Methylomonas methanica]OAI09238.1 hypothetical protein A1332_05955 [Methylomonas methanica]